MKKGTFIIVEKNERLVAAIKRADNQIIELDIDVTPDIQKLDGQSCQYLFKGDKIVKVGGRDIYKQQKRETVKPVRPQKTAQIDIRQKMSESFEEEPEIIENMQKPAWGNKDSFQLNKSRVPVDTKRVPIRNSQIDNFSLKLNQFARFEQWENKGEQEMKFLFFKGKTFQIQANFGTLFNSATQLADRQTQAAQAFFSKEGHLIKPIFKPEWRFVTGLGGHSVYETGITLHHVYGIPYIPASSIKGLLRSWVIFSKFENNEKIALRDQMFCYTFGCPTESVLKKAHKGKVTFFDAVPIQSPIIEPDIMNPHYPKWYGGNGAPVDTDRPNPVFFLSVKETPFQFLMGSKEWGLDSKTFWDGKTLGWWLENALSEHGIGAKTAVGYGYMKSV